LAIKNERERSVGHRIPLAGVVAASDTIIIAEVIRQEIHHRRGLIRLLGDDRME